MRSILSMKDRLSEKEYRYGVSKAESLSHEHLWQYC